MNRDKEYDNDKLCEIAVMNGYANADPKVIFVLKEPANRTWKRTECRDFDFKKDLEEINLTRMWKLLGKCSEGLQKLGKGCENITFDSCNKCLDSSCFLNLKRFGDGKSSNMSLVGLHAGLFWQLMMDEIKENKPNILVFCGTYQIFKELIVSLKELEKLPEYKKKYGYECYGSIEIEEENDNEKISVWNCEKISSKRIGLINAKHPGMRGRHESYFIELMTNAKKLLDMI